MTAHATSIDSEISTQPSHLLPLLDRLTGKAMFFSLALVFLWFGGMKFTAYEAEAIQGLIENSPFVFFLLDLFGANGAARLIGIVELTIAGLLATRYLAPRLAAVGALGASATFVLTSSFFLSTPGVFLPEVGSLAISVVPGQFLLKDIVLLAVSLWAFKDALAAIRG